MISKKLYLFFLITISTFLSGFAIESIDLDSMLIEENGFYGYLYKPQGRTDLKPIIVLGGSDGGIQMKKISRDFALAGYAAINVAYFKYKDLPEGLIEVPVEYFEEPIKWILNQKYVTDSTVAIFGFSRGAELALLLASEYPEISVTIAMAGSNLRWGGFRGYYSAEPDTTTLCAWTKAGKPMPYMNITFDSLEYVQSKNNAHYLRKALMHIEEVNKSQIAIDKSKSAFLLISGLEDTIWPSTEMSENAINFLSERNYQFPYRHLIVQNADHYFDLKKVSVDDKLCWDSIIDFIGMNLK